MLKSLVCPPSLPTLSRPTAWSLSISTNLLGNTWSRRFCAISYSVSYYHVPAHQLEIICQDSEELGDGTSKPWWLKKETAICYVTWEGEVRMGRGIRGGQLVVFEALKRRQKGEKLRGYGHGHAPSVPFGWRIMLSFSIKNIKARCGRPIWWLEPSPANIGQMVHVFLGWL